jgi:hypothetical protein
VLVGHRLLVGLRRRGVGRRRALDQRVAVVAVLLLGLLGLDVLQKDTKTTIT